MFSYKTSVKMHDTDAAGRIFFARQLYMFHDAWEAFVEKKGLSFAALLRKREYFFPIVHAEADYKAQLFVGDRLTVRVKVGKLGTSSIRMHYELLRGKELVGLGNIVHVAVSNKTGKTIPLPAELKKKLRSA